MKNWNLLKSLLILLFSIKLVFSETLPKLESKSGPQTFAEMWKGFDPRKEPLDVEVLHQWEEEGVTMKVIRYRIGMFNGSKAMMAGVYGHLTHAKSLPGLVNIHGGGQYADYKSVLTNAKRGYATISIAWAGRLSSPHYTVNPNIVKLFWEEQVDNPQYKVTTDWGFLDAYHAPSKHPKNSFSGTAPQKWTLDSVESPRNNPWFLIALGARRALTFLEQQVQVDPNRLGVYGHSMGGKLTVLTTAADKRVKVSAPSCGGISNRDTDNELFNKTISDAVNLLNITCPTIFLMPSNDFHGRIEDLPASISELQTKEWRVTCSPHHNHQDTAEYEVATQLWFDQHLKRAFTFPKTPDSHLQLKTQDGIPVFEVRPDGSKEILSVDIFYTQNGQEKGEKIDMKNTVSRHWHLAKATNNNEIWTAKLPLYTLDKPMWVYANVLYKLDNPVSGAGYYYGVYTADSFNLSSLIKLASSADLKKSNCKVTFSKQQMIEDFKGDWKKEWFNYKSHKWDIKTHKLYSSPYKAKPNQKLFFRIKSKQAKKMVVGLDDYAKELSLNGSNQWQEFSLTPHDFTNAHSEPRENWDNLKELRFVDKDFLRSSKRGDKTKRIIGEDWSGEGPQFQELKWID